MIIDLGFDTNVDLDSDLVIWALIVDMGIDSDLGLDSDLSLNSESGP